MKHQNETSAAGLKLHQLVQEYKRKIQSFKFLTFDIKDFYRLAKNLY